MRENWFFSLFQFAKIFLRPGPFKIALKYLINIFRNAKNIFEYLSLLAKKILRNSHYLYINNYFLSVFCPDFFVKCLNQVYSFFLARERRSVFHIPLLWTIFRRDAAIFRRSYFKSSVETQFLNSNFKYGGLSTPKNGNLPWLQYLWLHWKMPLRRISRTKCGIQVRIG